LATKKNSQSAVFCHLPAAICCLLGRLPSAPCHLPFHFRGTKYTFLGIYSIWLIELAFRLFYYNFRPRLQIPSGSCKTNFLLHLTFEVLNIDVAALFDQQIIGRVSLLQYNLKVTVKGNYLVCICTDKMLGVKHSVFLIWKCKTHVFSYTKTHVFWLPVIKMYQIFLK
jgi:hypothetical protein